MNAKKLMIVMFIIIALLLAIIVGVNIKKKNESDPEAVEKTQVEEYVEVKTDGTKVNTSKELSKVKKVDGLEISNIQLIENGNLSRITADVKNTTKNTLGDCDISIIMLDKSGEEMATIGGYIDKVEAGATVKLDAAVTVDVANAYDFKIIKQ